MYVSLVVCNSIVYYIRMKYLLLIFCYTVLVYSLDCNATVGNYISPHSLGQQDELNDTIAALCPTIEIKDYTYYVSKTNYTISNVSLVCSYFDGDQKSSIGTNNTITISGGKIQFMIYFNFTVSKIGPDTLGYGYGTFITIQLRLLCLPQPLQSR